MISPRRFTQGTASPIKAIPDDAWRRFLSALEVQSVGAISESGGLGSYDLRPRRLVEIGYATDLRSIKTEKGRQVQTCTFVKPWTQTSFLMNMDAQYTALVQSTRLYYSSIMNGEVKMPVGATLAGTLAVLHRGGKGALAGFPKLFEHTRALYESARGTF